VSKKVLKQLQALHPGDLIKVEWNDASIGSAYTSRPNISLDVGVLSFGLFICIMGKKVQHIMLAQNSFRMTEDHFRVDYTLIPVSWTLSLRILKQGEITADVAKKIMQCFLQNGGHTVRGERQRRVQNFA